MLEDLIVDLIGRRFYLILFQLFFFSFWLLHLAAWGLCKNRGPPQNGKNNNNAMVTFSLYTMELTYGFIG